MSLKRFERPSLKEKIEGKAIIPPLKKAAKKVGKNIKKKK